MKLDENLCAVVDGINMTLSNTTDELAQVLESDNYVFKTKRLLEICAELQVGLEFAKKDVETEIFRKKNKKFWQFWK
jgi:hypothetical protein